MISLTENKVGIVPLIDPNKTPGGLYIPDIARERCDQGIVAIIGPHVKDIKVGDHVLFGGYSGSSVAFENGETYIILREDFIHCKLEKSDVDVAGLYFKGRPSFDLYNELLQAGLDGSDDVKNTNKAFEICNRYINELFFPATYEQATYLIAKQFEDLGYNKLIKIRNKVEDRPKTEEELKRSR